jgi:hypothetical protein
MKTSTFTHYEQIILDNIDFEGYNLSNDVSRYDKVKAVYSIFLKEYVHQNNQDLSEQRLFAEWLQGLPSVLTVPFYYDEIIEYAKKAGIKIKDEGQFCNDYWHNLAVAFFTLKENL